MKFRIAVLGSGAIGSYYGAKLASHGCDVHFLVRSGFDQVRRLGIRVQGKKESFAVPKIPAYQTTDAIGPCDLVVIAVKTTNSMALIDLIPPLLNSDTVLLTLQNGLGNVEFLAEHLGADRVMGGLCFICLNRVCPGVIEHFDYGPLRIGEFSGFPKAWTHDIAQDFERCGVLCRVVENLACERWRKLVWNIPFNGLAIAAGGITTQDILQNDPLRLSALGLMDEVIAAANQCGQDLSNDIALAQIERTKTMGPYKPSTLLDFEAGRPLEINAMWDEPLRRAQAGGANTPRLEQLHAVLNSLNDRRE